MMAKATASAKYVLQSDDQSLKEESGHKILTLISKFNEMIQLNSIAVAENRDLTTTIYILKNISFSSDYRLPSEILRNSNSCHDNQTSQR